MGFKYTLIDENTLKILVSYLKRMNNYLKNNLHLAYGVRDKDNLIFVTVIAYITDCMKCRQGDYNDTIYAVVYKDEVYTVKVKSSSDEIKYESDFSEFEENKALVKGAIDFSENNTTYNWRNTELKDFDLYKYNEELISKWLS